MSTTSGRRPDTTRVWNFLTQWRQANSTITKDWNDLPQWFKANGYWSSGTGKTWHNGVGYNPDDDWSDLKDFPYKFSWPGKYVDINNTDVTVQRIVWIRRSYSPDGP